MAAEVRGHRCLSSILCSHQEKSSDQSIPDEEEKRISTNGEDLTCESLDLTITYMVCRVPVKNWYIPF